MDSLLSVMLACFKCTPDYAPGSSVDTLNHHTREQFVRLHSEPLLESLHRFFKLHHAGRAYTSPRYMDKYGAQVELDDPPAQGEFDLNEVRVRTESIYISLFVLSLCATY